MIDNRTVSAIDLALQKHPTPVGDVVRRDPPRTHEAVLQPGYRNSLPGVLHDLPSFWAFWFQAALSGRAGNSSTESRTE